MGTFKKNGEQKTHFGPHGDQSPQMGTNVGAVETAPFEVEIVENFFFFIIIFLIGHRSIPWCPPSAGGSMKNLLLTYIFPNRKILVGILYWTRMYI